MALTTQETTELLKLVQAQVLCTSAMKKMVAALKAKTDPLTDEFRTRWVSGYAGLSGAFNFTAASMGYVCQVANNLADFRTKNFPYPKNIDLAKTTLANASSRMVEVIGQLQNPLLGASYASALSDAQQMANLIQSFDITLPYAQPLPASYPRIIGPHGDYDKAQNAAFRGLEYFDEGLLAVMAAFSPGYTPTWPADAMVPYLTVTDTIADLFNRWARGTALTIGLELPDDAATIDSDTAHGSGLRPRSFFRVLLAHEYFMSGDHTLINFAERPARDGINAALILILSYTGILLRVVEPVARDYAMNQIGGPGSFTADLGVIWNEMDRWSHATLAFFYEIPAPPVVVDPGQASVIPPDYFTAENAKLDAVIAQAQQAAADAQAAKQLLAAKVGTTV